MLTQLIMNRSKLSIAVICVFLMSSVQLSGGDKKQGGSSQVDTDSIENYCFKSKDYFHDRKNRVSIKFNLELEFKKSFEVLGSGLDGLVKEVCYPSRANIEEKAGEEKALDLIDWPTRVAVKRIKRSEVNLLEIIILEKASNNKYGPAYYGCHLSDNGQFVYLVQEKLESSFFVKKTHENFIKMSPEQRLMFYRQLFDQAIALNNDGYINNDIKLDNIMFDSKKQRLFIFDFGVAQPSGTKLNGSGSPLYASPAKYLPIRSDEKAYLIDDLYSLAITIVFMESYMDRVFRGFLIRWKWHEALPQ